MSGQHHRGLPVSERSPVSGIHKEAAQKTWGETNLYDDVQKMPLEPDLVMCSFNPNTGEAEAGGSL